MTIAKILAKREDPIISCEPDTTLKHAIDRLTQRRIGAMPVLDDQGAILGIVSERDVIHCLEQKGTAALDAAVREAMTAPVVTVTPDTSVDDALSLMTRRRFRHLPVVDDSRMIGFVSIGDLVKFKIDAIEQEARAMRSYIQGA